MPIVVPVKSNLRPLRFSSIQKQATPKTTIMQFDEDTIKDRTLTFFCTGKYETKKDARKAAIDSLNKAELAKGRGKVENEPISAVCFMEKMSHAFHTQQQKVREYYSSPQLKELMYQDQEDRAKLFRREYLDTFVSDPPYGALPKVR